MLHVFFTTKNTKGSNFRLLIVDCRLGNLLIPTYFNLQSKIIFVFFVFFVVQGSFVHVLDRLVDQS